VARLFVIVNDTAIGAVGAILVAATGPRPDETRIAERRVHQGSDDREGEKDAAARGEWSQRGDSTAVSSPSLVSNDRQISQVAGHSTSMLISTRAHFR
jgi:hypothetical protein